MCPRRSASTRTTSSWSEAARRCFFTARGAETAAAHPLEAEIAALWSEVLGVANIGRSEKFFTLGGDSLTAMRILEALRSRFKMSISMRQLFAAPTVAELAAFVAKHSKRK